MEPPCKLCLIFQRVFQLLVYLTLFWMVGMILHERLPELLRGAILSPPRIKGENAHDGISSIIHVKSKDS